jgi:hypothetical protein
MSVTLWSPLVIALLWLVVIRAPGRFVLPVRVVATVVVSLVLLASLVVAVDEILRPEAAAGVVAALAVTAATSIAGIVGIVRWHGRSALILRWIGLVFVLPMVLFGAGFFALEAGLFYAPALQPAEQHLAAVTED